MPDWVPVSQLPAKSRRGAIVRYPLVNDDLVLRWIIEYGCVDMHVWTARADRPDRPDSVLFDLDPAKGADRRSTPSGRCPAPPVSTPLRWEELEGDLDPARFTMDGASTASITLVTSPNPCCTAVSG